MSSNPWWDYVQKFGGGGDNSAIAHRVGIDPSALTRWSKGARPDGHFAVKVARGLGRSPLEALVAAGFITREEADLREVRVSVEDLTPLELASELEKQVRRMMGRTVDEDDYDLVAKVDPGTDRVDVDMDEGA